MLTVTGLNVFYGESHVVRDVSFDLREGETVAIMGRNGMGKTTLLKSLIGILRPRGGKIILNDRDITNAETFDRVAAGMGYVPQGRMIFPYLTVEENILAGMETSVSKEIPAYVTIFRIHGPFLFGATDKIEEIIQKLPELPPILVLRLRNMTAIDATGLQALESLADAVHASGRGLILCGAREQPARMLEQAEFVSHLGKENILPHVEAALSRAREVNTSFEGLGKEITADLQHAAL